MKKILLVVTLISILMINTVYAKEVYKLGNSEDPYMYEYPNYLVDTVNITLWYGDREEPQLNNGTLSVFLLDSDSSTQKVKVTFGKMWDGSRIREFEFNGYTLGNPYTRDGKIYLSSGYEFDINGNVYKPGSSATFEIKPGLFIDNYEPHLRMIDADNGFSTSWISYILLTPSMANDVIRTGKFSGKNENGSFSIEIPGLVSLLKKHIGNNVTTNTTSTQTKVTYNGKVLNISNPININSRNYYPIRELVEALGGEVEWIPNSKEAVTKSLVGKTDDGGELYNVALFGIGKDNYIMMSIITYDGDNFEQYSDAIEYKMDAKPFIQNGKTYLPIKYVCDDFGLTANWNEKTKTIEIK